MRLAVVIIAKDEGSALDGCLRSITWADEIIVVDSGSADNTVEIAKQYGARVFTHEWAGYARQKNFAIDQARSEWVLSLDADERVTPELAEEIRRLLDTPQPAVDGYEIPRKNYLGNRWIRGAGHYPDYQLRLFRQNFRFTEQALVHERVSIPVSRTGRTRCSMIHLTYTDLSDLIDKVNRYTSLEAQQSENTSTWRLVLLPIKRFVWAYFYRLGFRDGWLGFVISLVLAFYTFLTEAKRWESASRS